MSNHSVKTLGLFKKLTILEKDIGLNLPKAYKKFYKEWKLTEPTAVHYVPQEGKWKRDDITGIVTPVQNIPIPLKFPPEHDEQLWGGEGVIQGFLKKKHNKRRIGHFWVPTLKRSVVYSEVLNKHISVVVTERVIGLIHSSYGFDHYLLKTPACDLRSLLAVGLKRKILQELEKGCPAYANQPKMQEEVYEKYHKYLVAYTPEEIEWYGLSFNDACKKYQKQLDAQTKLQPLKHLYRSELIQKLKDDQISEADQQEKSTLSDASSWIKKINPFAKKHET